MAEAFVATDLAELKSQQYSDVPNVVQGLLHPPGTLSCAGHSSVIFLVQLTMPQELDEGVNLIGMLKPCTSETS